jgi:hypothetical protein
MFLSWLVLGLFDGSMVVVVPALSAILVLGLFDDRVLRFP